VVVDLAALAAISPTDFVGLHSSDERPPPLSRSDPHGLAVAFFIGSRFLSSSNAVPSYRQSLCFSSVFLN
jgi:hypothetical protein